MTESTRHLSDMKRLQQQGQCQRATATNGSGREVNFESPEARAFCIMGASERLRHELRLVNRYAQSEENEATAPAIIALQQAIAERLSREKEYQQNGITYFNDRPETQKADVLEVISDAIAILEAAAAEPVQDTKAQAKQLTHQDEYAKQEIIEELAGDKD